MHNCRLKEFFTGIKATAKSPASHYDSASLFNFLAVIPTAEKTAEASPSPEGSKEAMCRAFMLMHQLDWMSSCSPSFSTFPQFYILPVLQILNAMVHCFAMCLSVLNLIAATNDVHNMITTAVATGEGGTVTLHAARKQCMGHRYIQTLH